MRLGKNLSDDPRIELRVRVKVRTSFERRSGDRTRVDSVCDFEKVPPDQLCTSAKKRLTGSHD